MYQAPSAILLGYQSSPWRSRHSTPHFTNVTFIGEQAIPQNLRIFDKRTSIFTRRRSCFVSTTNYASHQQSSSPSSAPMAELPKFHMPCPATNQSPESSADCIIRSSHHVPNMNIYDLLRSMQSIKLEPKPQHELQYRPRISEQRTSVQRLDMRGFLPPP
ncbi:hypothetical protein K461DRAFT_48959 [Myriangium duriaei CBS 260.36]|uniref:Uncharacterized protein n=1 Tax=Myriangium duriaei CBS 260.36 TaxID=1168546 RepID=A0A9P4ME53_9PEZI|nr:hypothetical protein K461DRAFT_48959 [Myriangium duriaei CBS 260.36]